MPALEIMSIDKIIPNKLVKVLTDIWQKDTNIWEMIPYYMGKYTEIYGKCVRKYMGNVSLGSNTYQLKEKTLNYWLYV